MIILNKIFKIFSTFIMLVAGMTACQNTTHPPFTQKQKQTEPQIIIEEESTPQTNEQQQTQQKHEHHEQTEQQTEQKTTQKTTESNITEKTKSAPFLYWGESNAQYWEKLQKVAETAQLFYNNNVSRFTLLSKGGKLYNSSTAYYVTTNYFVNNGLLEKDFTDFDCDILLLKGSDIAEYTDIDISHMDIGIFTAMKQPSGNKMMICSPTEKVASISEENYKKLLKKYQNYHGAIHILSPQMDEYERILNFIRVYEGNYDKYYVRDIRLDSKYAVVTFSSQNSANNIKQYVLVNKDNFWEVAINDLHKQSNLHYAVNSVLPDFNLNLLPSYNIFFYKNDMKVDFSDILRNMIYHELIEQQSQVQYICSTTNYCYIVLYGGDRYLGKKLNDDWDIRKVKSAIDAVDSMKLDNQNAPTFIVLDE